MIQRKPYIAAPLLLLFALVLSSCTDVRVVATFNDTASNGGTETETFFSTDTDTSSVGTDTRTESGDTSIDTSTDSQCVTVAAEPFSAAMLSADWTATGSAVVQFDGTDGHLELTNMGTDVTGALILATHRMPPGDLSLSFSFLTGPGDIDGADGLAVSVFDVASVAALETLLATSVPGYGLGYAVSGAYGSWTGSALHVEIDAFWNNAANGEPHTDPTDFDHIAVLRNGDAGAHDLFYDAGNLEDQVWRRLDIAVVGTQLDISLDGTVIISNAIAGLDYTGGYLVFTGSSGGSGNYHQIDNIDLSGTCLE